MTKTLKQQIDKELTKPKQEKETNMKNLKNNQTVKTILTVFITLLTVSALAGAFVLGMNYQKTLNHDTTETLKSVVSSIKVESKE